mmetsp:Transcript_5955/g.15594  ORF Transcript_5955/g.15594 Transcript_5955/m.15594 type:complete len:673 (+) Transcript_5955:62-2080(+)
MPESSSQRLGASARRPPLANASPASSFGHAHEPKSLPLTPGEVRSGAILHGQTALFHVEIPLSCSQLVVHLHRGSGDPLLMLRHGAPPRVPRRSRIVADFWDQEAFNANAPDHHVAVDSQSGLLVPGTWFVGLTNYNYHVRETCRYALTLSLSSGAIRGQEHVPNFKPIDGSQSSRQGLGARDMVRELGDTPIGVRTSRHTPTRSRPISYTPVAARGSPSVDGPLVMRTPLTRSAPHASSYNAEIHLGNIYAESNSYVESTAPYAWAESPTTPFPTAQHGSSRTLPDSSRTLPDPRATLGSDISNGEFLHNGADHSLAKSIGVLTDELARSRSELASVSRIQRGHAIVSLLGHARQLQLARAVGGWRAGAEATEGRRLARTGPLAERAGELQAVVDAQEQKLVDARAQAAFAQEHATRLTVQLERERDARAADAAAEFEVLSALLRARAEYEPIISPKPHKGDSASGGSSSGLLRLFAALGGDGGARELAEYKATRWRLDEGDRLQRQANMLDREIGRAHAADKNTELHAVAAEKAVLAQEQSTIAEALRDELSFAQADSELLRARVEELELRLERSALDLREAREGILPIAERNVELANAEAAVVQRTVERELRAMDELTIRIERVLQSRLAAANSGTHPGSVSLPRSAASGAGRYGRGLPSPVAGLRQNL